MKKPKPRNNGTMTESAFWSWVRSALRTRSMFWKPRQEILKENRRANQSSNKRLKWEFQCNFCKNWFAQKEIEVDHIIECGNFSKETAGEFIERLFCEKIGFQILCKNCHKTKTKIRV